MDDCKLNDYLEKEFGIKENQNYSVLFKLEDIREVTKVKGIILNFHPSQMVLKSNKGLYIIHPKNIVEMRPIPNMHLTNTPEKQSISETN